MKKFISSFLILLQCGCAPAQYSLGTTVDPTTGNITGTANISGTFGRGIVETRSYGKVLDSVIVTRALIAPGTRSLTRAVDECGNTRAIEAPAARRAVECPGDTRSLTRYVDSRAGGVAEIVDLRALSIAVKNARDTVRQTDKYDRKDLKIRQDRERHNENVAVNSTLHRSMKSWLIGHLFGIHPIAQPLPICETATIPVQTVPAITITPSQPVGAVLPDASLPGNLPTASDGSFSIPPATTGSKALSSLEVRVAALEANEREDHLALLGVDKSLVKIMAKLDTLGAK